MKRIKTNIIELDKLFANPCPKWAKLFVNGKIDAHEAFKKYKPEYEWLYENSNYDLIGWEIENGCFDWENYSWAVAQFTPQYFDSEKFNWKKHSWAVAKFVSQYFDPEKYNWDIHSDVIVRYAPQYFDPEKYNWDKYSGAIVEHAPQYFDPEKYNWADYSWVVETFAPRLLNLKPQTV